MTIPLNIKHLIIVGAWLIIYIVALSFITVKVLFVERVLLRDKETSKN